MTPFYAMYGYHPSVDVELDEPVDMSVAPNAQRIAEEMEELKVELAARWAIAVEKQAEYYDAKHKPQTYEKGDWVMLNGKNISTNRYSKKLDWKWLGPFKVLEPVGKQAYKLQLDKSFGRMHATFHISLLELNKTRRGEKRKEPQPIELDGVEYWFVDEILDTRVRYNKRQYLVHWKDTSPAIDSWEPDENLQELDAFRNFLKEYPEVRQGIRDSKKRKAPASKLVEAPTPKKRRTGRSR